MKTLSVALIASTFLISIGLAQINKDVVLLMPGEEGYPFSEGLARVFDGRYWRDAPNDADYEILGKYGFIDKSGMIIIPFLYEIAGDFKDGIAHVAARRSGSKLLHGFIYNSGHEFIPLEYEDAGDFSEGLAPVKSGGKWGYIDVNKKWVIKPLYDEAKPFSEGLAAVRVKSEGWGFINHQGELELACKYSHGFGFSEGLSSAGIPGKPESLIDRNGRVAVTFKNVTISGYGFRESLIPISGGYDSLTKTGAYGFGDKNGNIVIAPEYEMVFGFHEGLAAVQKNGKYGFLDKAGVVKIPLMFELFEREFMQAPAHFSEGLAFVKGGYINKNGDFVLKTK